MYAQQVAPKSVFEAAPLSFLHPESSQSNRLIRFFDDSDTVWHRIRNKIQGTLDFTQTTNEPHLENKINAWSRRDEGMALFALSRLKKDLPEDSLIRKICACIPLIGIFVAIKNEYSLKTKLIEELSLNAPDIEYVTRILKVSNHYRIASVVRALCTSIIACVGVYTEVIPKALKLSSTIIVLIGAFSTSVSKKYYLDNEKVIEALQKDNRATSQITENQVSLMSYIAQNLV